MTTQREVLEFMKTQAGAGNPTSFRNLMAELATSAESACNLLKRLWREGLIRTVESPPRRRMSLGPGESIRELSFRISRRGRQRLEWYAERDRKEQEEWLL
jgi:hypothetical protein